MSVPNAGQIATSDSILAEELKSKSAPEALDSSDDHDHDQDQDLRIEQGRDSAHLSSQGAPTEQATAPDQFDPRFESSKYEIWAYYCYYIGNNGLTLFNFAPTVFQELLSIAASDQGGLLTFLGQQRDTNSIVLLSNGISFAIQVVLFLVIGSYADFGTWRPWILIFWTIVAFALGFGWLGVDEASKWKIATGFYMIGLIAYQMCVTFWTAAFPGLARNTVEMRKKADQFENREISRDEYDFADMMQRNRISNVAFIMQSAGEIIILVVLVGILFGLGLNVDKSDENNLRGLRVLIAYATGCWIVLAIPWFVLEKRRPGQKVPAGMNVVSVGLWSLWRAMKSIWKLKQSLLYLIGYFLLGDSLNTSVTVIATLQNSVVSYDVLKLNYLFIVGIAAQLAGIFLFWNIQKYLKLSTKTMFDAVMLGIVVLDLWGMIGIFTQKFGFHNEWEFWVYQTYYGLFVCPWYSYSQIMISEVTPRGKEFLFFSLFSIMGKTSAFIGPIVSSAIIDADTDRKVRKYSAENNGASPPEGYTGNANLPFYFLVGISAMSFAILFFGVNLKKSRLEQAKFLEEEKLERERRASVVFEGVEDGIGGSSGSDQQQQQQQHRHHIIDTTATVGGASGKI